MTDDLQTRTRVRCARCGIWLTELRRMTKDHRPLCTYCPLGMDPSQYVIVGGHDD